MLTLKSEKKYQTENLKEKKMKNCKHATWERTNLGEEKKTSFQKRA